MEKWRNPMPEPGSPSDELLRLSTGCMMVPFGVLAMGMLIYALIEAAIARDACPIVALLLPLAWFGFVIGSALMYAFTGYYPRWFRGLWNVMWGWLYEPIPPPPPQRTTAENDKA